MNVGFLAANTSPDWLSRLSAACYLVSSVGFVVNYSLRRGAQRRLEAQVRHFYRKLRAAPLAIVQQSVTISLQFLQRLYGHTALRFALASVCISIIYFALVVWYVYPTGEKLRMLREDKAKIERGINPAIYDATPEEWHRARQALAAQGLVMYEYDDPRSVQLRTGAARFDPMWRAALRNHPHRTTLTILRLIEGNRLNPGPAYGAIASLLTWNVIVDLLAWITTVAVLKRHFRVGDSSLRSLRGFALMVATVALAFSVSLCLYSRFLGGFEGVFAVVVFELPFALLILAFGAACVFGAFGQDEWTQRVVIGGTGILLLLVGTLIVVSRVLEFFDAGTLSEGSVAARSLPKALAASTVLPGGFSTLVVSVALILKAFSEATRRIILAYLRLIFRIDKPVLLLVTATPGAVALLIEKVVPALGALR